MDDFQKLMITLDGKCPHCRGLVKEINLEYGRFTRRVLCLDCKRCSDDFTFGRAYIKFIKGE